MSSHKIPITPKTKVGELLDAYPDLEAVLMDMSPLFEKLKNPVLRRTVARVATLQQVAVVGGLKVDYIINKLRENSGLSGEETVNPESEFLSDKTPDWFETDKIVAFLDASNIINSGESPMADILRYSNGLQPGAIFELKTPFVPAPIIDMLKTKGFKVFTVQDECAFKTYISK